MPATGTLFLYHLHGLRTTGTLERNQIHPCRQSFGVDGHFRCARRHFYSAPISAREIGEGKAARRAITDADLECVTA